METDRVSWGLAVVGTALTCAAALAASRCGGVAVIDGSDSRVDGGGRTTPTASTGTGPCDVGDCSTCALTRCASDYCELGWFSDFLVCVLHCEPSSRGCLEACQASHEPSAEQLAQVEQALDCIVCEACYGDCGRGTYCPIEL